MSHKLAELASTLRLFVRLLTAHKIMLMMAHSYNSESDGGDIHDEYYAHRAALWPATVKRKLGENYEEGAALYGMNELLLSGGKQSLNTVYVGSLGNSYGDSAVCLESLTCSLCSKEHQPHVVRISSCQIIFSTPT